MGYSNTEHLFNSSMLMDDLVNLSILSKVNMRYLGLRNQILKSFSYFEHN